MELLIDNDTSTSKYKACPVGMHHAVISDIILMGPVETDWGVKNKIQIVFQTDAEMGDGKFFGTQKWYNIPNSLMSDKAGLRKLIEGVLGRKLTKAEYSNPRYDLAGFIYGKTCQINVVENSNNPDKTYVDTVVPKAKVAQDLVVDPEYVLDQDKPIEERAMTRFQSSITEKAAREQNDPSANPFDNTPHAQRDVAPVVKDDLPF